MAGSYAESDQDPLWVGRRGYFDLRSGKGTVYTVGSILQVLFVPLKRHMGIVNEF